MNEPTIRVGPVVLGAFVVRDAYEAACSDCGPLDDEGEPFGMGVAGLGRFRFLAEVHSLERHAGQAMLVR